MSEKRNPPPAPPQHQDRSARASETARDPRAEEARSILERAARESEGLVGSSLRRAGDHFAARGETDGDAGNDPIELWGRRVGRALSVVAFVVLAYWLGVQLRFW